MRECPRTRVAARQTRQKLISAGCGRQNPLNNTVLSDVNFKVATDDRMNKPMVKACIDDFNIIEELNPNSGATRHITAAKANRRLEPQNPRRFSARSRLGQKTLAWLWMRRRRSYCVPRPTPNTYESTSFHIRSDSTEIVGDKQLKILGFVFGQRPSCGKQVEYLRSKFRDWLWSMRKLKRGGMTQPDLVKLYTCCLRRIIESTGNTLHSMMTQEQSGWFEQAQALGLSDRRKKNFKKCTVKALLVSPNHEIIHDTRARKLYLEEHANTDKLYNSPMFAMRRYLNTLQWYQCID